MSSFAALFGTVVGLFLGYEAYNLTGVGPEWLGVLVGGATGYVLTIVGLAPVDAGSKALFVCYAESPHGLAEKSPELHHKLREGAPLSPAKESLTAP